MNVRIAALAPLLFLVSGACGQHPCDDQGSLKTYIRDVEVWLWVSSIPLVEVPDEATVTLDLRVAPVSRGGVVGIAVTEPVAIHSWFVEDVRDALEDGERAFLALSPLGGQAPLPVTNFVVRDPDGSHELAVDRCGYTEILMETFGERCDAVMHQLVVETSPRCLRALLDAVQY